MVRQAHHERIITQETLITSAMCHLPYNKIMAVKKDAVSKNLALTPSVEEGPYYTYGSPERTNITQAGTPGQKLVVEGRVLDKKGQPIAHAWLDFWQADGKGQYDNDGFNLRGHQFADKEGRYHLETVRPFVYAGRTAHIHAKVRANESSPILTVQLYFPGEKRNATDPLFEKLAVMDVADTAEGQKATFDFVVEMG
jgi:protocatechuate 3,4-dioxygenase beta subunit